MPGPSTSPTKRDRSQHPSQPNATSSSWLSGLLIVAFGVMILGFIFRGRGNEAESVEGMAGAGASLARRAGSGELTGDDIDEAGSPGAGKSGPVGAGGGARSDGPAASRRGQTAGARNANVVTGGLTRRRGLGPSTGTSGSSDDGVSGDDAVSTGGSLARQASGAAGKAGGRPGQNGQTGQDVVAAAPAAREPNEPVISLFNENQDQAIPDDGSVLNKGVTSDKDGARFPKGSEFAMPVAGVITGDSGTISFAMRPNEDLATDDNASLLQLRSRHVYENRLQLWQSGPNMNMVLADESGTEHGIQFKSDAWPQDEWRQVTVVWGDGQGELYVNGVLAGTTEYNGKLKILPDTQLHLGSNYPEDPGGDAGVINRFRVYDRALTQDEVAGLGSQATR